MITEIALFTAVPGKEEELGTAIQMLTQGLHTAREASWISDETAMQLLFQFCGLEIDIHEEQARIQAQQQRKTAPLPTGLPGSQQAGSEASERTRADPLLAGQMSDTTSGGVGPGGW